MDIDDLFGAFNGEEKAREIDQARDEQGQAGGKRKTAGECKKGGTVEAGNKRQQTLPTTGNVTPTSKEQTEHVRRNGDVSRNGGGKAKVEGRTALIEGQESSIVREDGTLLKSYSVYPVDWKPDTTYRPPSKPAKEYPFTLDPFQKQAIQYIERNESVLVSAHTSAGKTVNAEYAIAKCLRDKQRVIYTSPIKALSNQKFRDLQEEFGDVGLMTGDITINPSATCLIMTTEILRSMLYRGSEVMREVAWVIFDEIHYMRDKNRGVVWEESIILLPHKVRFVFLSATIPNSKEFCGWIAKTHHQPCHVVYTNFRQGHFNLQPVPLEHYIFPAGGEGLHLVVDNKGRFRENNFQKAMATLQATPEEQAVAEGKKTFGAKKPTKMKGEKSDLYKIVKLVMDRNLDPAIVFSFAKKECEANALQMSKLDFNDDSEKALVDQVFNNAMESLADDDRQLPQVEALLPLLKRGVGIHHGGLLPILKEVIEILFQEGLLKVLFATETFSIGLNMPARTVVFTDTRKFDGQDFRWITSGEYIQMSGRAGRRGKDDRGIVIQMLDEKMDPAVAKGMLYGEADPLNSSYHISYNMLLNMLRVEDADPDFLVRSSFHQYQQESSAPALEEEARELDLKKMDLEAGIRDDKQTSEYFVVLQELDRTKESILGIIQRPENSLPYIQVGRLLRIRGSSIRRGEADDGDDGDDQHKGRTDERDSGDTHATPDWGWGATVDLHKKAASTPGESNKYEVSVLVLCSKESKPKDGHQGNQVKQDKDGARDRGQQDGIPTPAPNGFQGDGDGDGEMRVVPFYLTAVSEISTIRVLLPKDLRSSEKRKAVAQSIKEAFRRFDGKVPVLHPVSDMAIRDAPLEKLMAREAQLQARLEGLPFHKDQDRDQQLERYTEVRNLAEKAKLLRKEAKGVQHVVMKDEMRRRKRLLRRLGHCDSDGVIQLKGRVACEINTCDELVVTELIFSGAFNDLSPEQSAALLSCLVHQAKVDESNPQLPLELQSPFQQLQDAARHVARVSEESKITIATEEYISSFTPSLMEATFAWSKGAKFSEVIDLTDEFEGSIIRIFRRLEELLRQLSQASAAIGNMELRSKFELAANTVRRGIVFAASLYL
ncbi:unnamed protein product [Ascophyllum nodosum]